MAQAKQGGKAAGRMAVPQFWRDAALPFIEARQITDGSKVCYGKHTHETFSIGVITGGHSSYLNGNTRRDIGQGAVVVMNPGEVHACNPLRDAAWSYRMLYLDVAWLQDLQCQLGFNPNADLHAFHCTLSHDPQLYAAFNRFYAELTAPALSVLHKHSAAVMFFTQAQQWLHPAPLPLREVNDKLARAAALISEQCTDHLTLAQICDAAELSASYLIRAFKKRYGMTPHAFLLDRRIRFARDLLRRDAPLAEVALASGFADQAHFQRVFKQLSAATPGQYRG